MTAIPENIIDSKVEIANIANVLFLNLRFKKAEYLDDIAANIPKIAKIIPKYVAEIFKSANKLFLYVVSNVKIPENTP